MLHDAGIAVIYHVEEGAGPPPAAPRLKEKACYSFGEMVVGVTRFYTAAAVGKTVSRLIEIWRDDRIDTRDLCRIGNRFYLIQQVTPTTDEDGILVTRLTLEETDGSAWEGEYVDQSK
mgnify:CR=1 FL=1